MSDEKHITLVKIAVTGGPCAGKSTAMSWINDEFSKRGWKVYIIAEEATSASAGNASPHEFADPAQGQAYMFEKQIADEEFFEKIARLNAKDGDKVMIVCDRGVADALAFLTREQQREMLHLVGISKRKMFERYDAVFHLVSAAIGAPEYYTLSNNSARKESPEQAAEVDKRTVEVWTGHPHLRIIDNSTDFHGKMLRLVNEVALVAGEAQATEIERKFLIEKPSPEILNTLTADTSEIIQTYLLHDSDGERRIRQRGSDGIWTYTLTEKIATEKAVSRIELEHRITEHEYVNLLMDADTKYHQIRKTRWCIPHGSLYYEIDIYPFSERYAIMEVELPTVDTELELPDFVTVVREVTDDPDYRNRSLAIRQQL